MRKRTFCLAGLLVLATAVAASAQITAGVKGGLNLANMSFDVPNPGTTPTIRTGAAIGGFVGLPVSPAIAIQPEVLFAMKGTNGDVGVPGVEDSLRLTYLDVPVLLRLIVPTTAKAAPFVYAGPTFGFPMSAKETVKVASGMTDERDFESDLKSLEVGIAFGGGVQFRRLSIEARFTQGLTNILTAAASDNGTATVKNRVIAILAGFKFK